MSHYIFRFALAYIYASVDYGYEPSILLMLHLYFSIVHHHADHCIWYLHRIGLILDCGWISFKQISHHVVLTSYPLNCCTTINAYSCASGRRLSLLLTFIRTSAISCSPITGRYSPANPPFAEISQVNIRHCGYASPGVSATDS